MKEEVNIRQLFLGFNVLVIGALFYYYFRSPEHTYFLKFFDINPHFVRSVSPIISILGNSLPTFIHVFAFSLMTAGLIAHQKRGYVIVCFFWFGLNCLFEIAQYFGNSFSQIIPDWFSNYLFLENAKNYFLRGRFDSLDLISILFGSLAAYLVLIKTKKEKGESG